MVLNLESDNVGVCSFGEVTHIKEGDIVKKNGQDRPGPVGEACLAVIDERCADWTQSPIETNRV